jgi:hypothetical protein
MNYTGELTIEPPLNDVEKKALKLFFGARHVQTVNGPLDIRKSLSQSHPDVTDWNTPAQDMPSLHCDLEVSDAGTLQWNGLTEAGDLAPWVKYVIDYFLRPAGIFSEKAKLVPEDDLLYGFTFDHTVNGVMQGVDGGEVWRIHVKANEVVSEPMKPGGS